MASPGARRLRIRPSPFLALALLLAAAAEPARAQDEEEGGTLDLRLDLLGEYDDNVALANDEAGESAPDDFVLRVQPRLEARRPFGPHSLGVDVQLDAREGTDTELSDLNAVAAAVLALSFPGGFRVTAFDNFVRTTFDQAVFLEPEQLEIAEPGVSKTTGNTAGARLSFVPVERFAVEGGGSFRHEEFDFGGTGDDEREVWKGDGRVSVPVTRRAVAYASYAIEDQDSRERPEFVYQEQRYVGGVRLQGPRRFTFFAEAGRHEVDYDDTPGTEFDGVAALGGVEAALTERSFLRVAAGRDGYENFVGQAVFGRTSESLDVQVSLLRSTENAFSRRTVGRIFESTLASVAVERRFARRWSAAGDVAVFLLDAEGAAGTEQEDRTGVLRLRLERELTRWLRAGAHYRFARKSSLRASDEFENHRFGALLSFTH